MAEFPNTRISLILRLARPADVQAWREFSELYAPVLFHLAKSKGLQTADAEDVTQDVLFAVARAAERFEPDAQRAKFRTWLARIARNMIADFFAGRAKRPLSQMVSDSWLEALVEPAEETSEFDRAFELQRRRALFRMAAQRVQSRVSEPTWLAFYRTAVERDIPAQVAQQLKLSVGGLYVARCRVLKMLRDEVNALESDEALGVHDHEVQK